MGRQPKRARWPMWTAVLGGLVLIVLIVLQLRTNKPDEQVTAGATIPVTSVSATGRIEPEEPVTRVGAPYVNGHPAIIATLKVSEGDSVKSGQVVATLSGKSQIDAAIRQGDARIVLAQDKLDQVKARPRAADVAAQKAQIARLQAAFDNTQSEYRRYEALHQKHDVSTSELDAKRTDVEVARRTVEEASARLNALSEIRPEDIRIAESELKLARAETDRLRTDLDLLAVRSPVSGVVLRVRAQAGEEVGAQGLIDVARTDAMSVIAEVYETDIGRVKVGERAEITSELLPSKIEGAVTSIGREIGRSEIISTDPAAYADTRVVRVKIRVADSKAIAGLLHGKVKVVLTP